MTELTPKQRITLSAIDAAGNIAEAAQAIAHALTEAASVLRQITAPDSGGDYGWPPDEDMVEDEAPEEEDTPAEIPIERPLDVERSDAGFRSGPIWVGGPGAWSGPGGYVYWSIEDRGITHEQLMNACEGLSDADRRAAHVRAGDVAKVGLRTPCVSDLLNALAVIRRRSSGMDDLQRLGQEFDAAPETGVHSVTISGSILSLAFDPPLPRHGRSGENDAGLSPEAITYEDELIEQASGIATEMAKPQQPTRTIYDVLDELEQNRASIRDAVTLDAVEALEGTAPTTGPSPYGKSWDEAGEAQDGPKPAEPSLSADASETGCAASPAVQKSIADLRAEGEAHCADLRDNGALYSFEQRMAIARKISDIENLIDGLKRDASPAAPELTPDGIEIHHPVKCTGPMCIHADLSRDVWDMKAEQMTML